MSEIDRRHFNRVEFEADASLVVQGNQFTCQVVDLSLHGVLIKMPNGNQLDPNEEFELQIPLSEDKEQVIRMSLKLTHQEGPNLGLECNHIDLDSITHLRRLVELNLGDSQLLERDFESLSQ